MNWIIRQIAKITLIGKLVEKRFKIGDWILVEVLVNEI